MFKHSHSRFLLITYNSLIYDPIIHAIATRQTLIFIYVLFIILILFFFTQVLLKTSFELFEYSYNACFLYHKFYALYMNNIILYNLHTMSTTFSNNRKSLSLRISSSLSIDLGSIFFFLILLT